MSILARYFAALYVMLPQLDTIGLRGVLFLCILGVPYNFGSPSDSGYSFQYSLSEMGPFLFHFLRMLIILFLYLCVGSLLSLVYVFVSPIMSVIFSLYSAVFMITVALPLSAGSMMMELSVFSVCRATLSLLLMLDFGSLARLMVRTTSPLSSSVAIIYFATTSVPAMISSAGKAVGVMAKFRPLLSIDRSSSLICLSLSRNLRQDT